MWFLWLVVGLIALVALVAIDSLVGRLSKSYARSANLVKRDRLARETHVFLPGILARCREQIDPLLPSFDGWGNLVTFDYHGQDFDIDEVADAVVREVEALLALGGKVYIQGISLGATLSAKVARRLREDARVDLSRVTFVLWDLPNGSEDFVPMPNGLGWIFAYQPGPLVSMTIGKLALRAVRGKPKDENIVYPSDPAMVKRLTGTSMNREQYAQRIKHLADRYQAGHSPRVWWRQLGAMHQAGRENLTDGAFAGFRVVCVVCMPTNGKNETVEQPQAFDTLRRRNPNVQQVVAPAQHCAFLEAAPVFHGVVRQVRQLLAA